MRHLLHLFLVCFPTFWGMSQLTTVVQSPITLVQNVLLGDPGITVTNISFQGGASAIGSFDATGTNLGIAKGIVMTTGTILGNSNGPIGPNNSGSSGYDNGSPGYSLLTTTVGKQTYNASVLQFDFSTCSDSIEFRYVFGSEEYPEWVGSQFNDVFGFYISGPGFAGQQNIARLPNGSVVAINNVNNGNSQPAQGVPITAASNPQYYVPNGNGTEAPYNSSNAYIQYDGFTRVLTAKAKVQCGVTYHLVLAIADVGDAIWDSGIFLEAKSFKANDPLKVSHTIENPNPLNPKAMAEPCGKAKIKVERTNCNINSPMTISITPTGGTATNGVDYQVPNSVTIPAGQTFTEFDLTSLVDAITEGEENIVLKLDYLDNCGDPRTKELELFIQDIDPVSFMLSVGEMSCPGDNVVIQSAVNGGTTPYQYLWSTGETTPSITVSPTSTTIFSLTVTDQCFQQPVTQQIVVSVPSYTPISLTGSADIIELCPYIPATLSVTASGGFGGYQYQWTSDQGAILGTQTTQLVTPAKTTTYIVEVTDNCGLTQTDSVTYTVISPPLILTLSPSVDVCPGDSVLITATVTGGYGQYYYHWPHSGETTSSVWVNPYKTTDYMVVVSDECQTFSVAQRVRINVVKPTANFNMISNVPFNNIDLTFQNLSVNATSYEWTFGDGDSSTVVHPTHLYDNPGNYTVVLIATDDKGCKDTIAKTITILEEYYIYVPNSFTPNEDGINDVFRVSTVNIKNLTVTIYDRWGEQIFKSDEVNFIWDGAYKKGPIQDGTYTYKISYTSKQGVEGFLVGHINLLR
ncbi:MAG: choice-of-anchor L domain-containing protein [Crocinitomicaceae bacterium]|nr:choice-of-anchor L domain-containing protein [Crocinitomicaceae bacterium]